jgi:hypothetical protein
MKAMKLPKIHFSKINKKLFWWVVAGLMVVVPTVAVVWAKPAPPIEKALFDTQTNVDKWINGDEGVVDINSTRIATRGVIPSIIEGLTGQLIGFKVNCAKSGSSTCDSAQEQKRTGGLVGGLTNAMAFLYTQPPASSGRFLAYINGKINPTKPVYAQVSLTGWQAMEPILPLWVLMRNSCYIFFVIIFVAIGFIIMLRQKIDAQVTASIQNSIPKIVIGLIMVTFSYAIAGLIIDISQLLTVIVATIFKPKFASAGGPGCADIICLIEMLTDKSKIPAAGVPNPGDLVANIFTIMAALLQNIGGIVDAFTNIIGTIPVIGLALNAVPGFGGAILGLVIAITIAQTIIKTFFMLLTSYATIVILTILSPFAFFTGSLPQSEGVSQWIKSMLSNVLIFPVTFLLILLAAILSRPDVGDFTPPLAGIFFKGKITAFDWSPIPFGLYWQKTAPNPNLYFIGEMFINQLLALGILMTIPKAGELVKGIVQGKGFGAEVLGGELGESLRGAARQIPIVGGLFG